MTADHSRLILRKRAHAFCQLVSALLIALATVSCAVNGDVESADPGSTKRVAQANAAGQAAANTKAAGRDVENADPAVELGVGGQAVGDAKSADAAEPPKQGEKDKWKPPPPPSDDHDWIRMKSGEWLKGEIKVMREGTLEFDSDEFDDQEIDWDDVAELRSPRKTNKMLFSDDEIVEGTLLIQDEKVVVGTADGPQQFARDGLRTIIPADAGEWGFWSGKLSLGLTARSGNTNQVDMTSHLLLRRGTPLTRFATEYGSTFGSVEGEETVNAQRANTSFDYFLTRSFFLTPVWIDYFRDPLQNIEYRITPGAGLGYRIFDAGDLQWDVGIAGAYRYTRFASVTVGEEEIDRSGAAVVGTRFETDITSAVDLTLDYSLQVGVPDIEETNMHARLAFEIELTSVLDLDVALVWERVGNPRPDGAGNVPEEDDLRITIGLGVDF